MFGSSYLDEIREPLEAFLRSTDAAVHFYRAECDCLAESEEVRKFCTAAEPGPKVLFCVNTPGVQQPIEGLAGAILVRESGEPGTFPPDALPCAGGVRPQAGAGVRP